MSLVRLHRDAKRIFLAGVKAVNPGIAVREAIQLKGECLQVSGQTYPLKNYKEIYVIGAGKASAAMAQPLEELLGDRLKTGIILVKHGHSVPLKRVRVHEAGHPVPDRAGLIGTREVINLLRETGEDALVFFLISGGGSALLPCPAEGLTLEDKQKTTQCLLESGASIQEINAIRKHISQIKGGRLARLAFPSTLVSLILSDVIGDELESIASGPTVPDNTTFSDCLDILEKYGIQRKIPAPVLRLVKKGAKGKLEETPKRDDPVFKRTQNVVVGCNTTAVRAAEKKARELGYHSLILSTQIKGEAKEAAKVYMAVAKEILRTGHPVPMPACVISGGETTVTIKGKGLGGRNQEFVLASAIEINGLEGVVVLSCGTDGTDGPTDAAGAVADGTTFRRAKALGKDAEHYLRENDSYHFFQSLGDLVFTGPTYTNVMDLMLVIVTGHK